MNSKCVFVKRVTAIIIIFGLLIIAVTLFAIMLMRGKEVSNRKQKIDRQYHTIPNKRLPLYTLPQCQIL